MPKKRTPPHFSKPQTAVHPSISGSRHDSQNDSHRNSNSGKANKSVNDLLQRLRVAQAPAASRAEPPPDVSPRNLYPSVMEILQIPPTPPPRPRPGTRPARSQGRRRPPGPAAPRSWAESSHRTPTPNREGSLRHSSDFSQRHQPSTLGTLPGLHFPSDRTLQHQTLVLLAKNWDWHVEYDQHYLALLPVRYKQLLLSYIARYSPNGINAQGLETLFLDESILDEATGTDGLTHLDLAFSMGRSLSLKELQSFLTRNKDVQPANPKQSFSPIPDSWDATITPLTLSPTIPSSSLLATLTHLSLAHPHPYIRWHHLLALSPALSTLTHLSLARWPVPTLTPNSSTAFCATPAGNVDYGDHNHYTHSLDQDFSSAVNVLRRLSRDTYCLRWLDLSGCIDWIEALTPQQGGVEWNGAWKGMEIVVVSREWLPPVLQHESTGDWKDLLKYKGNDSTKCVQRRHLLGWLWAENRISDVVKRIKGGRTPDADSGQSRPFRSRRASAVWDGGDDVGGREEQRESTMSPVVKKEAKCKVEFERGWEGWWIEDALRCLREKTSYIAD